MHITTLDALFEYLHECLCLCQPRVAVPAAWIEADINLILTQRRVGGCAGQSATEWQVYISCFSDMSRTKLGHQHAVFIDRFLAELAARGEGGWTSITETALMMIECLGFMPQFEIDMSCVLRLRSEFVEDHGRTIAVPIDLNELDLFAGYFG